MMDDTSDKNNVEQSAISVQLINEGEVESLSPDSFPEKLTGQSYEGAVLLLLLSLLWSSA